MEIPECQQSHAMVSNDLKTGSNIRAVVAIGFLQRG
jgi:hypothetical protein